MRIIPWIALTVGGLALAVGMIYFAELRPQMPHTPALFARLRTALSDGPAHLPGSYQEWRQRTAHSLQGLEDHGWTVIHLDIDLDHLAGFQELGRQNRDHGDWAVFLRQILPP